MTKQTFKHQQFLPAAFIVLTAAVFGVAQEPSETKQNIRPATPVEAVTPGSPKKDVTDSSRFSYEFTQPEFLVRHIVIDHDATGRGTIIFTRKNEENSFEEPIRLSPSALGRVLSAWAELRFLESTENYQTERQYAHLGTMRLRMEHDTQKRTAEFNWTSNKTAALLVNEYRRVADQAILIFDISIARETQPLATPKLMEEIELQMKRNGLSDPKQLLPLLTEVSTDEHLPLIARNHALRLIKKIEK